MTIKVKYIAIAILVIAFAIFQYFIVRQLDRVTAGIQQQILFTKTYFPEQVSDFMNKLKASATQSAPTPLPEQPAQKAPENNG